jgi:hypothetical protein
VAQEAHKQTAVELEKAKKALALKGVLKKDSDFYWLSTQVWLSPYSMRILGHSSFQGHRDWGEGPGYLDNRKAVPLMRKESPLPPAAVAAKREREALEENRGWLSTQVCPRCDHEPSQLV